MNQVNMSQMLEQMRAMAAQAQSVAPGAKAPEAGDFASMLKQSVETVSATQQQAAGLAQAFEKGDSQVDLAEVMVALQKASVSFQAMTQVRNKLVEAYQDIKNMPI